MGWITLGTNKGWTIKWDDKTHKMFCSTSGFFGSTHHFEERPYDRVTAFEVAKAWINARR